MTPIAGFSPDLFAAKRVVVTGAAGGIGRAVCDAFVKVGKELLEERIGLVGRETDALRERIAGAEASISEADKSKIELVEESDRLKAAAAGLADGIVAVEARSTSNS